MKAKFLFALVVIAVLPSLAVVLEGASAQLPPTPPLPPYGPWTTYLPLPDDDSYLSRPGTGAPCPANNNVGNSANPGTYHVYSGASAYAYSNIAAGTGNDLPTPSVPLAMAIDGCKQDPDTGEVVDCFIMALIEVVETVEALDPDPTPLVDPVLDCNDEGTLNTGTDGEFEWGAGSAWLQVRTGATSHGNGGGTHGCLGTDLDGHHGTDTVIHVLDASLGSNVAFAVTADWSHNARPGDGDCGDGLVEPCAFSGPPPAAPSTIGDTFDWIFWNLEATTGCNPLDYSSFVEANESACTGAAGFTQDIANCWDATARGFSNLADVGSTGYEGGGASGMLVVFMLDASTAGWIWTDTTAQDVVEYCSIDGLALSSLVDWLLRCLIGQDP